MATDDGADLEHAGDAPAGEDLGPPPRKLTPADAPAWVQRIDDTYDRRLLRRVVKGDVAATNEFLRRRWHDFERICFAVVGPHPESEDIVQEAALAVTRSLNSFKGESKLSSWLYSVCGNVARSYIRKRPAYVLRDEEPDADDGPAIPAMSLRAMVSRRQLQRVFDILNRMSENQAAVFRAAQIEGLEAPEVAERLGISVKVVYSRLHQARRSFYEACEDDPELREWVSREVAT